MPQAENHLTPWISDSQLTPRMHKYILPPPIYLLTCLFARHSVSELSVTKAAQHWHSFHFCCKLYSQQEIPAKLPFAVTKEKCQWWSEFVVLQNIKQQRSFAI